MITKICSELKKTHVIPCFSKDDKLSFFNKDKNSDLKKNVMKSLKLFNFKAKKFDIIFLNIEKQKVLVLGLEKEFSLEDLRRAYAKVFRYLDSRLEDEEISVEVPSENKDVVVSVVEGIELANYKFDRYITKKKVEKNNGDVEEVADKLPISFCLNIDERCEQTLDEVGVVTKNVKYVRNLVNENSDIITPAKLEKLNKDFASKNKLKVKVLDEKQIERHELNLLHAVGKGSSNPPRLIIMEYKGNPKSFEKIALVGKGITFDTGGANLKPSGFIEEEKADMAGAAALMGVFNSAVELKLQKNLILVLACAENCLSSKSFKPGDVYRGYGDISVEIKNTDGEGRLVLADAISYVQKNYSPTKIIDMATLTGAKMSALGCELIGMCGNDDILKGKIFESGESTYERVWELPIYEEHREAIKSKFADVKNTGGKYGGMITAAAFIEKFVEKDINWVHLDIAGAEYAEKDYDYIPLNATGRGVRLLIDYLRNDK